MTTPTPDSSKLWIWDLTERKYVEFIDAKASEWLTKHNELMTAETKKYVNNQAKETV